MTEDHQKYVKGETMVSIVLSIIISLVFAWLVFPATGVIPMGGMGGIAFDLLPTTFMIIMMTTVALSILTGARRKKGAVSPLNLAVPGSGLNLRLARVLPDNFFLRGLVLAISGCIIFIPLTIAGLDAAGVGSMTFWTFMGFKAVYGAFLAVLFTPVILIAALGAGTRNPAASSLH